MTYVWCWNFLEFRTFRGSHFFQKENRKICERKFIVHILVLFMCHFVKCPNTELFLVRTFSHSDWIRRDTKYLSVFSPNEGKYRPEITLYLDAFRAVYIWYSSISVNLSNHCHFMHIFLFVFQMTVFFFGYCLYKIRCL